MTKPKIAFLNLFTGSAAYILAGGSIAGLVHLLVAGFLAVGGLGAVNNYLDMDIDSKMARTSKRPLPAGRLSPKNALVFGSSLILLSLLYSLFMINPLTSAFISLGAFIYIFVYTMFLKRRSVWNIVIGGAAGSCSPLAGWVAAGREFTLVPAILAILVFLWTPGHFWALAIRAEKDYASAGVPVLPVVRGMRFTAVAILVSNLLAVATALVLTAFLSQTALYLAVVMLASLWLIYENVKVLIRPSAEYAWRSFKVSSPWLAIVFSAIVLAWR